jgi:thioredoxin 1
MRDRRDFWLRNRHYDWEWPTSGIPTGHTDEKGTWGNISMRIRYHKIVVGIFCLSCLLMFSRSVALFAATPRSEVPIKGIVTMVDLGAKKCIPCKMMAPILEKLEKEYAGRAAIVFFDVWEDPKPARRFAISGIPTQIFFNKEGKEVFRHLGFLSEEKIKEQLTKMGVD